MTACEGADDYSTADAQEKVHTEKDNCNSCHISIVTFTCQAAATAAGRSLQIGCSKLLVDETGGT